MSRIIAVTADELLSGTNSNVMAEFDDISAETSPGVVVLASANKFQNGDLTDVTANGRTRGWRFLAPPKPDSWNVYIKQVTTINASGTHVPITDATPALRQNIEKLDLKTSTYDQDYSLLTDKSLPDTGDYDPDNDLAPPVAAARTSAVVTAGNVGYPAGTFWVSYCGIIGANPYASPRITNCAPPVQLTGVTQGQILVFLIPDDVPDVWTGIGFVVGSTVNNMKLQIRVDIRDRTKTEATSRKYVRSGPTIDTATNRTLMGAFRQFNGPKHWRDHASTNLASGTYHLSYSLITEQGISAAQQITDVTINTDQKGETIKWIPHEGALKQPGVVGWRPEFKGSDNNWYTFADAKGGYGERQAARIHVKSVKSVAWKHLGNKPVKISRSEVDHSGVGGPPDSMEVPTVKGADSPTPGRYAVRVTLASDALDMESAPSARTTVTLRDAGLNGGGAATFVSDQMIRVWSPHPQNIKNSELMEVDPATGTADLHWERFTLAGVSVTASDGFITVADSSAVTGTQNYRRSAPSDIDPTKHYTMRFRMNVTARTAGTVRMQARFLDAGGTQVGATTLEDFRIIEDVTVRYTMGPVDRDAHFDIPATAAQIQVVIQGVGAAGDLRGFTFSVSNIGVFQGKTTPRKVYDIVFAENTPGHDVWPVPDTETDTLPYPAGPYCRTVINPAGQALALNPTYIEQKGFEDGSATSNSWTQVTTTGAVLSVSPNYALHGDNGARADIAATSTATYGAYIWKDFFNSTRSTFGTEVAFRLKTLPSAGTASLLAVTRDANLTSFLAHAQVSSTGVLSLVYWNGTAMTTLNASGVAASAGDDLRIELQFSGLRTASGSVSMRIKRNQRPTNTTTVSSLNWAAGNPGGNAYRVMVGVLNGSTAASTFRVLFDKLRLTTAGMNETTQIPGNMVEYWAPFGQPAGNPDHFMTDAKIPVKGSTTYVTSCYVEYSGVTTPAAGAELFNIVSMDSEGNPLETGDHGYMISGIKGRMYWDRYYISYTTPPNAAYIQFVGNHVGDGLYRAMAFQHETGTVPTAFTTANLSPGTFTVVLKVTPTGGPLDGDIGFTDSLIRVRDITTHQFDVSNVQVTTSSIRVRGATTTGGLSGATWYTTLALMTAAIGIPQYIEVEVTLTTSDLSKSPEVRAVYIDVKRTQPILCRQDGRDFHGGALVYQLVPASPVPTVVRKEYADGSVGTEALDRFKPPERVKMSVATLTKDGKRAVEFNPVTDEPLYRLEAENTVYVLSFVPEFTGGQESGPDGVTYFDYVAEGLEADVVITEDQ